MFLNGTMEVCPISIVQWYDQGLNPCVYELLCATGFLTMMLLYLSVSFLVPSTSLHKPYNAAGTCIVLLHAILTLLLLARCLVQVVYGVLYAYFLIQIVMDMLCWILSTSLYLSSLTKSNTPKILILFWYLSLARYFGAISAWNSPYWFWQRKSISEELQFILFFVQLFCVLLTTSLSCCPRRRSEGHTLLINARAEDVGPSADEEESPPSGGKKKMKFKNPTIPSPDAGVVPDPLASNNQSSAWSGFFKKIMRIFPFMWPTNNFLLQLCVLVCVLALLATRVVNVFMPILYGAAVNELTSGRLAIETICLYCLVAFCQGTGVGSGGLLGIIRSQLWLSITQYTSRQVQVELFQHIHGLSMNWHLSRKTGEVIRIMDRSSSAITNLLNYIVFSVAPCFIDIGIAIIYFIVAFNVWYGVIIFVTMAFYMVMTIVLTEWRTKFRREMNQMDNDVKAKAVDSLLNFETVKYYGAEDFETKRYGGSLEKYLKAQYISSSSLSLLNLVQNIIISAGTLGGSLLIVYDVHHGTLTVGDFVLFVSYLRQLYMPLNWFGTYYRMIQVNFIDMENMFELLEQPKDIQDVPGAATLVVTGGRISFDHVTFHYRPEKVIIKDLSFIVESGKSVALVGPSGGGKSTIMKLLFRFYDIKSGCISIDNQDITQVTQRSLREVIGVVPQDTVLFNETIRYNLKYGKVDSSDTEVEEATVAADMHEQVMSFPDGYETVVGERGLKLSGGEKQRVAIARTLLKSPNIVLLDEATSALDTTTERNIQASLNKVCLGKTCLIIAHRLSTVIHCDKILVLEDGQILESGTHADLLAKEGIYSTMWKQQSNIDQASATEQADKQV